MMEKLRSENATRIELEFFCNLCVENLAKPIGPSDESVTNEILFQTCMDKRKYGWRNVVSVRANQQLFH
jgi:hypothetical protein